MRLLAAAFIVLAFSAAIFSPGFFEADEISHFLKARAFASDWKQVLDIWGRPACTGLFGLATLAVPFAYGLIAARVLAVGITLLTILGTLRLYENLRVGDDFSPPHRGRNPSVWLILLLFAQPLFLMNSFAVMTEMLLACAWVWAAALSARNRLVVASVVLGLGGLARPEGWFAIAVWPVFLVVWWRCRQQKFVWGRWMLAVVMAGVPVFGWYVAGVVAYGNFSWPRDRFPWHAASQYGTTGLFFVGSSLVCFAVWMWFPIVRGVRRLWAKNAAGERVAGSVCVLLLTALPMGCFFVLHGTLGTLGLMGSMSLPRYFVAVAPFAATLALVGLPDGAFVRGWVCRVVITLIVLPALVLIVFGQLPTSKTTDMRRLDVAMEEFRSRVSPGEREGRLIAGHPYIFYVLGLSMDSAAHARIFDAEKIRTAAVGTYVLTDTKIWMYENRPGEETLRGWGYVEDRASAAKIDAVVPGVDLTTLGRRFNKVRLWVKEGEGVPPGQGE